VTPDTEAQTEERKWIQRKLNARNKILTHLEARLQNTPDDPHLLFLQEEHLRARDQLFEEMKSLDLQWQEKHLKLSELVDAYLSETQASTPSEPQEQTAQTSEQQAHLTELKTWKELLEKVEERLLRLPGDPRLLRLRSEHQWRILCLEEALSTSQTSPPSHADQPHSPAQEAQNPGQKLPAPPLEEKTAERPALAPETESVNPSENSGSRIEKELETWKAMLEKTRNRLLARPELTHLKPLLAEYQSRIEKLEAECEKEKRQEPKKEDPQI